MASAPMNHPVAATGATVVLVNSIASRQEVLSRKLNQNMMGPAVVEALATVLARMTFVVLDLDFVARVSCIVQA